MTHPETRDHLRREDPFAGFVSTAVVEAAAERAVAEQRPDPGIDNHVGARHAGALFTVGFEASRALVAAALGNSADSTQVLMVDSEIEYEKVAAGRITATAEPAAEDWASLLAEISSGRAEQLPTEVKLRDEAGKTVASMRVRWQVSPTAGGLSVDPG